MLRYLRTHSAATLLSHWCSRCLSGCFGSKSKCSVDHLAWDHFHSGFGMVALVGTRVQNPLNPFFSKIYGTVTLEKRAAECSVTAHLAGFGKCCSGFVHSKILTRWFLCLFVCLFVCLHCMVPVYFNLKSTCDCKLYWYYDFLSHAWIGAFYGNNIVLPNWVNLDNDQGN